MFRQDDRGESGKIASTLSVTSLSGWIAALMKWAPRVLMSHGGQIFKSIVMQSIWSGGAGEWEGGREGGREGNGEFIVQLSSTRFKSRWKWSFLKEAFHTWIKSNGIDGGRWERGEGLMSPDQWSLQLPIGLWKCWLSRLHQNSSRFRHNRLDTDGKCRIFAPDPIGILSYR